MTDASAQNDAGEHPMVRLAQRLATTMGAQYKTLLEGVTRDGDVDLVLALHEAGLLEDAGVCAAVLPLPHYAKDRARALEVVLKAISTDGKITTGMAAFYFARANTEEGVRTLADLGLDPNEWIRTNPSYLETPVAKRINKLQGSTNPPPDQLAPILAILDVLRQRNVVPLIKRDCFDEENVEEHNIFQSMAWTAVDGNTHTGYPPVAGPLAQTEWPDSWRQAAGRAIFEVSCEKHLINSSWQIPMMAGLMSMAKFADAQAWKDMFESSLEYRGLVPSMANRLPDPNACGDYGVAVVRNMAGHGVSMDEIAIELRSGDSIARGTLLHGAIIHKNETMIEALLDAGSSPAAVVLKHPRKPTNADVGLSAVDLAQRHFKEALPMLQAKLAKDAILRTISEAAGARKSSAGEMHR